MDYENYFTGVPGIGNLSIERILVEDDIPVFFVLISEDRKRYICTCCEIYEEQRWLIAPVSNYDLIKFLRDEISLRNIFLVQDGQKRVVAHWSKDNPVLRYDLVDTGNLLENDLPADEYLELDQIEFDHDGMSDYIELLKKGCHRHGFIEKQKEG